MGEKLDPKETVSLEELVLSNVFTQEAIINTLVRKGLLSKQEILEEIERLKKQA